MKKIQSPKNIFIIFILCTSICIWSYIDSCAANKGFLKKPYSPATETLEKTPKNRLTEGNTSFFDLLPPTLPIENSSFQKIPSDLTLTTHPSDIVPYIDGEIEAFEAADASFQEVEGTNEALFKIYTKLVSVNNEAQIYLALKVFHETIHPGQSKFVNLYFDEGDDGAFGSGSRDENLSINQEDLKTVENGAYLTERCLHFLGTAEGCPAPSCGPKNQNQCWECAQNVLVFGPDLWEGDYCYNEEDVSAIVPGKRSQLMDGSWKIDIYGTGWYSEGFNRQDLSSYDRINYKAYQKEYEGYLDAEFLIPLEGRDEFSPGIFDDVSDIRVVHNDVLGIGMSVLKMDLESGPECANDEDCDQANDFYCKKGICKSYTVKAPQTLDRFDASTYAQLKIKTCRDTDSGDDPNQKGAVFYFDVRNEPLMYVEEQDYCVDVDRVFEYWCQDNNYGLGAGGVRHCSPSQRCSNGQCLYRNQVLKRAER